MDGKPACRDCLHKDDPNYKKPPKKTKNTPSFIPKLKSFLIPVTIISIYGSYLTNNVPFLIIVAILALPLYILFDSKERQGKYSWGWIIISFLAISGFLGTLGNRVTNNNIEISDILSRLIFVYIGVFFLYHIINKKKQ